MLYKTIVKVKSETREVSFGFITNGIKNKDFNDMAKETYIDNYYGTKDKLKTEIIKQEKYNKLSI